MTANTVHDMERDELERVYDRLDNATFFNRPFDIDAVVDFELVAYEIGARDNFPSPYVNQVMPCL